MVAMLSCKGGGAPVGRLLVSLWLALILTACRAAPSTDAARANAPRASLRPYSVTLSVADIDRVAAFYTGTLGMREVKRKDYPEFQTQLVFLELEGFRVELIRDGKSKPEAQRPDPPAHTSRTGISQFCFETQDLGAVRQALERQQVTIVFPFENEDLGVRFFFVRDPEGNLVQFLERR